MEISYYKYRRCASRGQLLSRSVVNKLTPKGYVKHIKELHYFNGHIYQGVVDSIERLGTSMVLQESYSRVFMHSTQYKEYGIDEPEMEKAAYQREIQNMIDFCPGVNHAVISIKKT